jgi:hypothetical protein
MTWGSRGFTVERVGGKVDIYALRKVGKSEMHPVLTGEVDRV